MAKSQQVDVRMVACPRCEATHEEPLDVHAFAKPTADGYTHWALCPTTGDPILIKIHE